MSETDVLSAETGPGQALALTETGLAPIDRLLHAAVERNVPVETLERLLAMHERVQADQARRSYFEALSAFQAACPVIGKDRVAQIETKSGGSFSYRYAPLETIMQAISPALRQCGLSVRFDAQFEAQPPAQLIRCIVSHRDGHSEQSEFRSPVDTGGRMTAMQQAASALTYGRRYALLNALGIVVGGEDDDGHGGSRPGGRSADGVRGGGRPTGDAGGAQSVAPESPPPAAPVARPRGRNLVRIQRPSQGPQGSDGTSTTQLPTEHGPAVAETPAVPERDIFDVPKAEARQELIEMQMAQLRGKPKYANLDEEDLRDVAVNTLNAACQMQFARESLLSMSLSELEAARVLMADKVGVGS